MKLKKKKTDSAETLLCTISLALFPPSRQESVPVTRAHLFTHAIDFAATHCHQVAGNGNGPEVNGFTLLAVGEGTAEAGVMAGSKGSACVTS